MKKEDQEITLLNSDVVSKKYQINDNFKTTNINVLLNRVRLDKKRTFKKRIIILFSLVLAITCTTFFYIFLKNLH